MTDEQKCQYLPHSVSSCIDETNPLLQWTTSQASVAIALQDLAALGPLHSRHLHIHPLLRKIFYHQQTLPFLGGLLNQVPTAIWRLARLASLAMLQKFMCHTTAQSRPFPLPRHPDLEQV
jgi:hypothetical protein